MNDWEYETCHLCTREQRLAWVTDDVKWKSVMLSMPSHIQNSPVCLECFLKIADDENIKINIDDVQFEGIIQNCK